MRNRPGCRALVMALGKITQLVDTICVPVLRKWSCTLALEGVETTIAFATLLLIWPAGQALKCACTLSPTTKPWPPRGIQTFCTRTWGCFLTLSLCCCLVAMLSQSMWSKSSTSMEFQKFSSSHANQSSSPHTWKWFSLLFLLAGSVTPNCTSMQRVQPHTKLKFPVSFGGCGMPSGQSSGPGQGKYVLEPASWWQRSQKCPKPSPQSQTAKSQQ